MQIIPRWRNILYMWNSLVSSSMAAATTLKSTTTHQASFHSTPVLLEKWKKKFSSDGNAAQRPTKNYIRHTTRQKRSDARKALENLLFHAGSSRLSFEDYESTWDNGNRNRRDKKQRPERSSQRPAKCNRKKNKPRRGTRGRDGFDSDFETENIFQATFGNRWYTWSSREEPRFRGSTCGFEWREGASWTNQRTNGWDHSDDDESCTVGSHSDRTILGLPPTGPLKIEDVKTAFRSSALKWHPDKHQGPSQATAEEKFKLCVNAYKSLCAALA